MLAGISTFRVISRNHRLETQPSRDLLELFILLNPGNTIVRRSKGESREGIHIAAR
jgi:hypothetical protein